ncbi:hypothetical protein [Nostoc sp. TCL240-02]|uniref:hypothetical protein n=1 Tax=Nostoc sp. TCL240-02 TaxID=2572090 RepID=UPI00157F9E3A|nr:hypothetical protein [Nostoc sp. TCL240-02]
MLSQKCDEDALAAALPLGIAKNNAIRLVLRLNSFSKSIFLNVRVACRRHTAKNALAQRLVREGRKGREGRFIEFGVSFIEFGVSFIEFGVLFIEFGVSFIEFGVLFIEFGVLFIEFGQPFIIFVQF